MRTRCAHENHVESSYIMYADEFAGIQAIYRYIDELDEERREQRHKDLAQSRIPMPYAAPRATCATSSRWRRNR